MFIEELYAVSINENATEFEFISVGKKGSIKRVIRFTKTPLPNFYNLGFGDKIQDSDYVDDKVVTDNGDTEKILATIASTIFVFTEKYPNSYILLLSQNLGILRLYRIAISKFFARVSIDFEVLGMPEGDKLWKKFKLNTHYVCFLIHRNTKFNDIKTD